MNQPLKIKICGMRDPENIERVCQLHPDFIGYIFYHRSKRFVGKNPPPEIFRIPAPEIARVGVFVEEDSDVVLSTCKRFDLDFVQLHGNESPEYCERLKKSGVQIIKVIHPEKSPLSPSSYINIADYLLFDSGGKTAGGSGKKFNWEWLDNYSSGIPFFLSGGIGPGDSEPILALDYPDFRAIDLNSRFEKEPGIKDVNRLNIFLSQIRNGYS